MSDKIYLNPVIRSGLGEDTFWTWFEREFDDAEFGVPNQLGPRDVVLHYSTKGAAQHPANSICLLWELYPEMKLQLQTQKYNKYMAAIDLAARTSAAHTISSNLMVPFYEQYGILDILPIAVNADLFTPMENKAELREKHGIPADKKVAFWGGNTHDFKGSHILRDWAQKNPDVHIIAAWTYKQFASTLDGASNYVQVPQRQLAELMNCADFFLRTSLLRPYYMVEWEAMACDIPFVFASDVDKEFDPGTEPRKALLSRQWDRATAKKVWRQYIEDFKAKL